MSDYISRQAAIEVARENGKKIPTLAIRTMEAIKSLPAADVVPVVHARWEKKKDSDLFYCSECGLPSMHKWPYCEQCGAKMDGERKELEHGSGIKM